MEQKPTHKLSSWTLVTGREIGSCISALTAARKVSLFLNYPCDTKFFPLWKKPQPPRALDRHTHWALSLLQQPHHISAFKANKIIKSANSKWTNQKSIELLWVTIPFSSDQEIALLQLDFNIQALSARLAPLNTLKPYHVLSQEHTTTKCFNRPTLSFSHCSFIYHTGCTQHFHFYREHNIPWYIPNSHSGVVILNGQSYR